jgi:hypothetical protein
MMQCNPVAKLLIRRRRRCVARTQSAAWVLARNGKLMMASLLATTLAPPPGRIGGDLQTQRRASVSWRKEKQQQAGTHARTSARRPFREPNRIVDGWMDS